MSSFRPLCSGRRAAHAADDRNALGTQWANPIAGGLMSVWLHFNEFVGIGPDGKGRAVEPVDNGQGSVPFRLGRR